MKRKRTSSLLIWLFTMLAGGCTFERYSLPARRAVANAVTVAQQRGHDAIKTEDLLLGLMAADPQLLERVRLQVGYASDGILAAIDRLSPARPASSEQHAGLPFSPELQDVLDKAAAAATDRVTTRQLLLALLHGPGLAGQVLRQVGVTEAVVLAVAETSQDA